MGYGSNLSSLGVIVNDVKGLVNKRPFGVVSVTEFGAVGDGVTDDTDAIQNAVNAAVGKRLIISPGEYAITSINLVSNIEIVAYGAEFILIDTGLSLSNIVSWSWETVGGYILPAGFLINGESRVIFKGGLINGNYDSENPRAYPRPGIMIHNSSFIFLRDMEVKNTEGNGIWTISSGVVWNYLDGADTILPCSNIWIDNCYVHDLISHRIAPDQSPYINGIGIEINRTQFATVMNCLAEDGTQSLFRTEGAKNTLFNDCRGNRTTLGGEPFDIFRSYNVTLESCYASGTLDGVRDGGFGISVYENVGVKVLNCISHVDGYAFRLHPELAANPINDIEIRGCSFDGKVVLEANYGNRWLFKNNVIKGLLSGSRAYDDPPTIEIFGVEITDNIFSDQITTGFTYAQYHNAYLYVGGFSDVIVDRNTIGGKEDKSIRGIYINATGPIRCRNNKIRYALSAIYIGGNLSVVILTRNEIEQASVGIFFDSSTVNISTILIISDNYLASATVSTPITLGGVIVAKKIQNNFGYVTESQGASTGTGAQQTIAHGLANTPTTVMLGNEDDGSNAYQSTAADATNIYITAVNGKKYQWLVMIR